MAKTGDPKNKGQAARDSYKKPFVQAQFVRYNITDEEKAACKKWEFGLEELEQSILTLTDHSYKVTFRYDDYAKCACAWIIAPQDDAINPNMILSGRGSTPVKAFKQAAFLHFKVFDLEWPKYLGNETEADFDD